MPIGAKMVQPYSHDLLCGNFFEMIKHDGIQQLDLSSFGQIFQKYHFWEVTRTQFGPKFCNLLSYDTLFVDFFKNFVA